MTISADAAARAVNPDSSPTGDDSAAALWEAASGRIRAGVSEASFAALFQGVEAVQLQEDTLILRVPNVYAKERIEAKHLGLVVDAVSAIAGRSLRVSLLPGDPWVEAPADEVAAFQPAGTEVAAPVGETSILHPKYNFESFVIGSSNRFAHAAALAVAEGPASAYNPLFIYGGAGLGKTHLLHAIGRYVYDFHSGLVVRYVSTEQFMNDFILALQRRTIPNFHSRYRAADLLLVDDIQFLEGKERTQEEFFHTFNALHPKSQIVITSDRPPKKISTLEERLRTRFEWGLITDIQPPDLETRLAILQKKAETESIQLSGEVMSYIASRIQTNIRELEGALIRVAAYASLTRTEATLELAQNVLQSLLPDASQLRITPDLVISVAGDYFDVTPDEICSASRSRHLVTARQMAMYLVRELTDLSLPKIGERFGGRDHSTVIHATQKVKTQMQERQSCFEQVRELTTRVRQQAARG